MYCFACYDGFYLDMNGDCIECTDNCEICFDSEVCLVCEDGYLVEIATESDDLIYYGTQCFACSDRCETCIFERDICTSCGENFKLNGTTCIGKYVVGFLFVFDYPFEDFLENSESSNLMNALAELLGVDLADIVLN